MKLSSGFHSQLSGSGCRISIGSLSKVGAHVGSPDHREWNNSLEAITDVSSFTLDFCPSELQRDINEARS